MSSPMMTRILGFACWACATLPVNTISAATSENMSSAIRRGVVVLMRGSLCDLGLAWLDRAGRPGGEPRGGQGRPLLHGVLGIAPLPLGGRLDGSAADPLVDPLAEQLAGRGVRHLRLGFRPADEGIGPGGEILERAQQASLRDH